MVFKGTGEQIMWSQICIDTSKKQTNIDWNLLDEIRPEERNGMQR